MENNCLETVDSFCLENAHKLYDVIALSRVWTLFSGLFFHGSFGDRPYGRNSKWQKSKTYDNLYMLRHVL